MIRGDSNLNAKELYGLANRNKQSNIMVCVTQQKNCEKLIKKGLSILDNVNESDLYIINVVKEDENFLYNSNDGDALEYLFSVARKADADMMVIRDDDVTGTLADFAKDKDIGSIVLGASLKVKSEENHPIVKELKEKIGDDSIEYIVV